MKIATIQSALFWENTTLNLNHLDRFLNNISIDIDVIVLPEMFTTGFSMNAASIAVANGGKGLEWMQKKANLLNACIVGSIAVLDNQLYFNRLYWVFPDGSYKHYDKKHLFRMANEHHHYTPGNQHLIIDYNGMRFCPFVCYDLRFPKWSRNIQMGNNAEPEPIYDCAIYVANWPAIRSDAWQTLLKARALENVCYVVGVNRVGLDGNGVDYDGKSSVFCPKGLRLDNHLVGMESFSIATLSQTYLNDFRAQFPAFLDADI